MMDWEKYQRSLDAHSQTVKRLKGMSEDGFYNQSEDTRELIFNPLNIFYIQKIASETRGIYKVHLDSPVERRNEDSVKTYQIKADSLNAIQESLGEGFIIIGQDLICPLNRIRKVDKALETITLRRMVLSEYLKDKFGLKREEKLRAGRASIRLLNNAYCENFWIKFSKISLVDESQKDLWGNEFGNSIYFNPMDIAYIVSTKGIKAVQLRSINAGRSICPVYEFHSRKALIEVLGSNLFRSDGSGGVFVQINSGCFVSIYCLMSQNSRLLGGTLSLNICTTKSKELKVGKTYIGQVIKILNGCQKNY